MNFSMFFYQIIIIFIYKYLNKNMFFKKKLFII